MTPAVTQAIAAAAADHAVDPSLLTALVLQESGGSPWAWRPEPTYRYFWDVLRHRPFRVITAAERLAEFPPADFRALTGSGDQEWWGQQASWGLCQLMGAVARELGFPQPYLTQLGDPAINLDYGARHLAALLAWAGGDERQALGAYNAGKTNAMGAAGRAYADHVLQRKSGLHATPIP